MLNMAKQIIYAERVHSEPTPFRKKSGQDYYEVVTGNIMIALNDHFDDMCDKEWELLSNRITAIFKKTRGKRGIVKTVDQKVNEVTAILKDVVYLNEKEIKRIVTKVIENDK